MEGRDSPRARKTILQTLRMDTSTGCQDRLDSTPRRHLQATLRQKKFVLKVTHQILPMGKIFNKMDPSKSITCSSCKLHLESATHLYRCRTRRTAMEAFLHDTIESFLQDNHTSPELAYTLLKALSNNLDDDSFPEFRDRHGANAPEYQRLHQLQAYVGWPQLFQGHLVQEWSQLHEVFLANFPHRQQPDREYYTGTTSGLGN